MPAPRDRQPRSNPPEEVSGKQKAGGEAPPDRQALIRKALALIERRIDEGAVNASMSDLIRLMEFAGEVDASDQPVEVRWVDPPEE